MICDFSSCFRHRWAHAEGMAGTDMIGLPKPVIDDDLSLPSGREPFDVEQYPSAEGRG